jgi:hypothetical protein
MDLGHCGISALGINNRYVEFALHRIEGGQEVIYNLYLVPAGTAGWKFDGF